MKTTLNYNELNKSPALTWNWLKANRGKLELEVEETLSDCMNIEGFSPDEKSTADNANLTVTNLSDESEVLKKFPHTENSIQRDAVAVAEKLGVSEKILICAKKNTVNSSPLIIHFNAEDKKTHSSLQLIKAEENSSLTVIMDFTSVRDAEGFQSVQTKLWAEKNAQIHLVKVQMLGKNFTQIDSTDCFCAENAKIRITQIELGGKTVFASVNTNLSGEKSSFESSTSYLCGENQKFDMNYAVLHHGKKTDTKMKAKGSVSKNGIKIFRGTIDFKNGCSGATGDELEETLLLSPDAVNKSLPVILCGEEDVSGTHGATLGRLGADELFYFESRGIDEKSAEKIMAFAKIQESISLIPDEKTQQTILNFMQENSDEQI